MIVAQCFKKTVMIAKNPALLHQSIGSVAVSPRATMVKVGATDGDLYESCRPNFFLEISYELTVLTILFLLVFFQIFLSTWFDNFHQVFYFLSP